MNGFNHKLLDTEIEQKFKTNKMFMIALNNAGIEIKEDAIKKWRQGNSTPKTVYISKICNILKIHPNDLLEYDKQSIPIFQTEQDSYIELPTIYAGAGAEALAVERAEKIYYPKDLLPDHIKLDENTLAIKIAGNSMEPLYCENDIVFIDMVNGREFIQINGTYLVRYGYTVQIKDVEFLGNGEILLFSRNSPAVINPRKEGLEWEIVGKPFAMLHPTLGSKLETL